MDSLTELMRQSVARHDADRNYVRHLEAAVDTYQRALKILCLQKEQTWTLDEIERAAKDPRVASVHGYGVELLNT
jgi:hypothetical protein